MPERRLLTKRRAVLVLVAAAISGLGLYFTLFSPLGGKERDLQIRPSQPGQTVPDGFYVYQKLSERGIRIQGITPTEKGLLIHLEKPQQQEAARQILRAMLPAGIIISPIINAANPRLLAEREHPSADGL